MAQTRLNLDKFFENLEQHPYALFKLWDQFPAYYRGGDADILCLDKNALIRSILLTARLYIDAGWTVKICEQHKGQSYVDLYQDGRLEFRFDVYESLAMYQNIRFSEDFIPALLNRAQKQPRGSGQESYHLSVPATIDEMVLRYADFREWYKERPDKIKHWEYVEELIGSLSDSREFFDALHLYLHPGPKRMITPKWRLVIQDAQKQMVYYVRRIKTVPVWQWPGIVAKKFRLAVKRG